MISRRDARWELYEEVGDALGWHSTATTLGSASMTDPVKLGGYAGNYFANQGEAVFPGNSENDRRRALSVLSSGGGGTIALRGPAIAAASQGSNKPYEFVRRGITWDQINEAFWQACQEVYFWQRSAVGNIFDGDFLTPDYDGWLASHADVTFDFDTAAALNDSGYYSLVVTYAGTANTRYLSRAAHFHLEAGEQLHIGAIAKLVSGGPAYWDVYNETTGQGLRSRVQIDRTGEWFHLGGRYAAQSAGNYNIRLGADAPAVVAYDCFPNHYINGLSFDAPSWVKRRDLVDRIDLYDYSRTVSQDLRMARSRQFDSWERRKQFDIEMLGGEPNAARVQVLKANRSLPDKDMFYRAKRLISDLYVPDETTPTPGLDDGELMAAFRVKVYALLEQRDGEGGTWTRRKQENQGTENAYRQVEEEQVQPDREPKRRHMAV